METTGLLFGNVLYFKILSHYLLRKTSVLQVASVKQKCQIDGEESMT